MSDKTTLNVRGSFYNMTDEFYNPVAPARRRRPEALWPNNRWYSSLYNSGYVYLSRRSTSPRARHRAPTNPARTAGAAMVPAPDAWTMSARLNRYQGRHNLKWGGEVRAYYGEAAALRADQPGVQLDAHRQQLRHAGRHEHRQPVGAFLLGALDNQTSARLVPAAEPGPAGTRRTSRTTSA
jgi:hypothetical protein